MLFQVASFLKPGAEELLIDYSRDFNEYLGPSARDILVAGALRDYAGKRVGYLAIVERDSFAEAKEWLRAGPLHRAGLSEREQVLEFELEVGRLG